MSLTKQEQKQVDDKTLLGFWVYLMTDCILFGSLFATYVVLAPNTNGGPSGQDLFDLNFILVATILLLVSSLTSGLMLLAAREAKKLQTMIWLSLTFVLGLGFIIMELMEFSHILAGGHDWGTSGFLSAFFTLVGTHGLHIAIGLLWIVVLAWLVIRRGFKPSTMRRLSLFGLYWHFLDLIWIFIFTVVYLMGGLGI